MRKISGGVLVVILGAAAGLLLSGCGEIPTLPPRAETWPPTVGSQPASPTATPRQAATVMPTPMRFPTLPVTPAQSAPVQATPYVPAEALPASFEVAYVRGGTVWTLSYGNGVLQERFLAQVNPPGRLLRVALSPDGGFLAIESGEWFDVPLYSVHIVGMDGSVRLLDRTDVFDVVRFGDWSPDGREILVRTLADGWLLSVDGSSARPVSLSECDEAATFSPNGRYIFCSGDPLMTLGLVDVSTGMPGTMHSLISRDQLKKSLFYPANFAWSPDGKRVAFTWDKLVLPLYGEGQLWLMNADGSGLRALGADDTYDFTPAWSPDNRTIAFVRRENPPEDMAPLEDPTALVSSIWLIDAETGQETVLLSSEGQHAHWAPKWLPDGSGLLLFSDRGGGADLWFVRPDGGGLQQLTRQGGLDGEVAILPQTGTR